MNATQTASKGMAGPAQATAAERAAVEAERQRRARGPEVQHRLMMMQELLVNGISPEEALIQAQMTWRVSRRTALKYLRRLRKRLTESGHREDQAYVQQLGLTQRGRVLGKLLSCMRELDRDEPADRQFLLQLAGAAGKLIDARDRSALQAHVVEQESGDRPAVAHTTRTITLKTSAHAGPALLPDAAPAGFPTDNPNRQPVAVGLEASTPEVPRTHLKGA